MIAELVPTTIIMSVSHINANAHTMAEQCSHGPQGYALQEARGITLTGNALQEARDMGNALQESSKEWEMLCKRLEELP